MTISIVMNGIKLVSCLRSVWFWGKSLVSWLNARFVALKLSVFHAASAVGSFGVVLSVEVCAASRLCRSKPR